MDIQMPPATDDEARLDELALRYWDGALLPSELAELNRLLAERPSSRALYNELAFQVFALREAAIRVPVEVKQSRFPRVRRRVVMAGAGLAAAVFVCLLTVFWPFRSQPVAHIEQVVGRVRLLADGHDRAAGENDPIFLSTTVSAVDEESSATIVWADGSRLVLSESATVAVGEVAGAKEVRLLNGSVALYVEPQLPSRPMRCVSPEAVVEVVGTKLVFGRDDRQSRVSVLEGVVRAGPAEASVPLAALTAGQTVVVGADRPLRAEPRPFPPDTFRRSLFGWTGPRACGEPVPDWPPSGAPGSVRATLNDDVRFAETYVVRCPRVYDEGLFAWHPDTVFHVRLRTQEAGPVFVNINTRFADPTTSSGWVQHAARVTVDESMVGEWHTFQLPAERFKQNVHGPAPDGTPRVAVVVCIGTGRVDRGLSVDEFWVTRSPE
jgi:ferric-dicitrate binding protein FerR (iron transport regulator)